MTYERFNGGIKNNNNGQSNFLSRYNEFPIKALRSLGKMAVDSNAMDIFQVAFHFLKIDPVMVWIL